MVTLRNVLPFSGSRRLIAQGVAAVALSFALTAPFGGIAVAQNTKVPVEELMAAQALPDIVQGKADAPVTIVEYASMTCTHCAAFHT